MPPPAVDTQRCVDAATAEPGGRGAIAALLEAQFHHMGRDVQHPAGNLLHRLGFTRQRPPSGLRTGTSRYVLSDGPVLVAIWPFALCIGDRRGAALLPRRGRASWWPVASQPDCFTARQMAAARAGCVACPAPLVGRAFLWLAGYEQAVDDLVGTAHREPAERSARAGPGDGYALQAAWRTHAGGLGEGRIRQNAARPTRHRRPGVAATPGPGDASAATRPASTTTASSCARRTITTTDDERNDRCPRSAR
jgi:hypothetical protein